MADKTQIKKYATEAHFIFSGKVVKTRASTIEQIATDNTVIILVEKVIKAPEMFMALGGQNITVRFKKLPQLRVGSSVTIFCNGWIFGKTLAVDAIGYTKDTDKNELVKKIQLSRTAFKDDVLKKRIDSATMGVVGTVVKVEKTDKDTETTHFSEHDPNWHEATINVDEVVKGKKNTKEIKVLFPRSDDVRWHKINKYSEGQKGIWLLQKGRKQDRSGIHPKVLAAIPPDKDILTTLHPVDFLTINELGKVKSLLKK